MFEKVLIANRGEIAVRIARTLQQRGIRAVAVHSEADRRALHVAQADEAYALPGVTSAETYLRGDLILEIAERHGVDAVHPGYGFLSENADFAAACGAAGVTFIGPSPDSIRAMGDKVTARRIMEEAGVPVVPGWSPENGELDLDELARRAGAIGYPVLLKAAAGGGGRGMRVVSDPAGLASAAQSAQREAEAAFGDGRLFVEKYLPRARHIEFQILADEHGNVVHLCERECSIQRRHQKIIEESPSPGITDEQRRRMGNAAVRAAQAAGYTNAGTVEFMAREGEFYFLEMNTRLQVEHPVTEMILGRDLVADQLRIAAGETLGFAQDDVVPSGHAVECRIYAEDAERDYLPSTGVVDVYDPPSGPNIRVDSGITAGSEVSVHYDPMLAKLVAWGRTRDESLARITHALDHFAVLGVTTNIEFLRAVVEHASFRAGDMHTGFLEEHAISSNGAQAPMGVPMEAMIVAAAVASGLVTVSTPRAKGAATGDGSDPGPWQAGGAWRAI